MKNFYILLIFTVFVTILALSIYLITHPHVQEPKNLPDGSLEFTFLDKNYSHTKARKIFYIHTLKNKGLKESQIKELSKIIPSYIHAFFIDMNNDGQKDIIGVEKDCIYHRFFLTILVKDKKNYKSGHDFIINGDFGRLYVLKSSTNGYKDIRAYGIYKEHGEDCIFRYNRDDGAYDFSACNHPNKEIN